MKFFCLAAQLALATANLGYYNSSLFRIFSKVLCSVPITWFSGEFGPEVKRVARSSRSRHNDRADNRRGNSWLSLKYIGMCFRTSSPEAMGSRPFYRWFEWYDKKLIIKTIDLLCSAFLQEGLSELERYDQLDDLDQDAVELKRSKRCLAGICWPNGGLTGPWPRR